MDESPVAGAPPLPPEPPALLLPPPAYVVVVHEGREHRATTNGRGETRGQATPGNSDCTPGRCHPCVRSSAWSASRLRESCTRPLNLVQFNSGSGTRSVAAKKEAETHANSTEAPIPRRGFRTKAFPAGYARSSAPSAPSNMPLARAGSAQIFERRRRYGKPHPRFVEFLY